MFEPGTLILFESVNVNDNDEPGRFFLKFLELDDHGLKMEGGLPRIWRIKRGEAMGPKIWDGSIYYRIVKVDVKSQKVWIAPASCSNNAV